MYTQVLQAPLLKDLNTLVDSQSPGAAVSGKGLPPKGGHATSPQGWRPHYHDYGHGDPSALIAGKATQLP